MEQRTKESIPNPITVIMALGAGLATIAAGGLVIMWTVMALPSFMRFIASGLDVLGATQVDILGKSILTASPLLFLIAGFCIGGYLGVRGAALMLAALGWLDDAIRPDWRWLRIERRSARRSSKKGEPKGGQPA